MIVDEKSGQVRDSQNYLGQWMEIDASGRRLVTAGTFSRIVGQELLTVPRSGPANSAPSPTGAFGPCRSCPAETRPLRHSRGDAARVDRRLAGL